MNRRQEIWDMVPGKDQNISEDEWLDKLVDAVLLDGLVIFEYEESLLDWTYFCEFWRYHFI